MNTVFGVRNKSLATIDSLSFRLSNSNQASFFALYKVACVFKAKIDPQSIFVVILRESL